MPDSDIPCPRYLSPPQSCSSCSKPTTEEDACLLNCGFALLPFKRSLVQEAISLFLTLKKYFLVDFIS